MKLGACRSHVTVIRHICAYAVRARSRGPDRSVHAGARRFPGSPPRFIYSAALPTPPRSATAARGQRASAATLSNRGTSTRVSMPIAVPPTTQTPRVKSRQLLKQRLARRLEAAGEGREILNVGHAKDHMGVALTEDVLVHARRALARHHQPNTEFASLRRDRKRGAKRRPTAREQPCLLLGRIVLCFIEHDQGRNWPRPRAASMPGFRCSSIIHR